MPGRESEAGAVHSGPDLSVHTDHDDREVAGNAGLAEEVERLRRQLTAAQEQHRQDAERHTHQLDSQMRAHAEAMIRVTERAEAAQRDAQQEAARLTRLVREKDAVLRRIAASGVSGPGDGGSGDGGSAAPPDVPPRRGSPPAYLVAAGVGGLLAGVLTGVLVGEALRRDFPPATGSTVPSQPASTAPAVEFVDLPCQKGAYAVRLSSFAPEVPGSVGLSMRELVQLRADEVLGRARMLGVDLIVQATGPGNEICPGVQRGDSRRDERTYVFAGPMTKSAAERICTGLLYSAADCMRASLVPEPTATP